MVDRIHRDAARVRAPSEPAPPARLAVRQVLVLEVADLADRRPAAEAHAAELARGQLQQRVVAFLRHELDGGAGAAPELRAAARPQLDGVDGGAERDAGERQAVARLDVGLGPGLDGGADAEPDGRQDVAPRPIRVLEERDARGPVRIVLDRLDHGTDADLVPPEVDDPVEALVPAAPVSCGHAAAVVAAAGLVQGLRERRLGSRLRDLAEVEPGAEATPGRGGTELDDWHDLAPSQAPSKKSMRLPSASVT